MKRVVITFGRHPTPDYPLAVVVHDDDPNTLVPVSQDYMVRSVRDGRVFGNGMCAAARQTVDAHLWPVNPELDHRLVEQKE